MLEGLWLTLLAVACLNPRARPQACLLLLTWLMSYAAVYMVNRHVTGYQAGAFIDAWGFLLSAFILSLYNLQRCWWALFVTTGYALSVAVQVIFWRLEALELVWVGREVYLFLVGLYTCQTMALAMSGVMYRARRTRPREVLGEKRHGKHTAG